MAAAHPAVAGNDVAPDLAIAVEGADVLRHAAAPTLAFRLRIDAGEGRAIRSLALTAQVRIDVTRRSYDERAQRRLVELFGEPDRWGQTLRSLLWTHAALQVGPFTGSTTAELPLACTYDLDVAASKYLNALGDGEVPLELLFSGTVFYAGARGLQVARIPWDRDARFRLPVATWRAMMDHYFPGQAWLRLRAETLDRLAAYRAERALPSWDAALDDLLARGRPREGDG